MSITYRVPVEVEVEDSGNNSYYHLWVGAVHMASVAKKKAESSNDRVLAYRELLREALGIR